MGRIELYRDQSPAQYQAKLDELSACGYRILSLSAYGSTASPRYATVWAKQDGSPWVSCHGRHPQEFQEFFDHWTAQGYRMTIVTAIGTDADAVFAAVFERRGSPEWFAKHGLVSGSETTPGTFQFQSKLAQTNGYILTWATVYGTAASPQFAAIWERNPVSVSWQYRLNQSDAALQADLNAFDSSGGEPLLITCFAAANSYLTIWRTVALNEWWADHGLTGADLDAKVSQNQAKGIFALRVQGSGAGNQVRFAVKWGYLPPELAGSWWTGAETFGIGAFAIPSWGVNGVYDWGTLAQSKVTFVTHCPIDRQFFERCHAMNVRCFPYVVFYMGSKQAFYGPIISNTYEGVDFGNHSEFFEVDAANQNRVWVFGNGTDGVGVSFSAPTLITCPNVQAYQDKMAAWVDYIMGLGADGVFVDVLIKHQHCYGAHQHIVPEVAGDPDAAQNRAFALLLKRVRQIVKKHKPDGLILGNSSDPLNIGGISSPEFQKFLDADMMEDYICQGVEAKYRPTGRVLVWNNSPVTWDQLGRELQPSMAAGKRILVIPVLDDKSPYGVREDAFFTYASARLAGFIWYGTMTDARVIDLFRLRLGEPVTSELTAPSGVFYRVFERGLAAVNPDLANPLGLPVESPIPGSLFFDVFSGMATPIDTSAQGGLLTIPPYSGRIYLYASSTDYGLNRLT